jgi:hypothetical protein
LDSLLDAAIDVRGLTPSRAREARTPAVVVQIVFGSWFEPGDQVRETLEVDGRITRCSRLARGHRR